MIGPALPPPRVDTADREQLRAYFRDAWELNELLFSSVIDERALSSQPDPLRNPLIFYWGHTAAFFINKLRLAGLLDHGVDDRLDQVLAVGVDPATAAELATDVAWPRRAPEIQRYRGTVRAMIEGVIDRLELPLPLDDSHPGWALLMAIEHARIHFETSSVLLRQADVRVLRRPDGWRYAPPGDHAGGAWVAVDAGRVTLGRDLSDKAPVFGWDNEFGSQERRVVPFEAWSHLITNAEFDQFVMDGGYQRSELWSEAGWLWRISSGAERPRFVGPDRTLRATFDVIPLPEAWPVEVNAHEAAAYCAWLGDGAQLPTEAQWRLLSDQARGPAPLVVNGHNLALRWGSPSAVGACDGHDPSLVIHDAVGNVWQWLADDFAPLPGFAPHRLYEEFSAPYFDPDHGMMAGGSWATTGAGASRWYRLWFRRHFYQHAGFRPVRPRG